MWCVYVSDNNVYVNSRISSTYRVIFFLLFECKKKYVPYFFIYKYKSIYNVYYIIILLFLFKSHFNFLFPSSSVYLSSQNLMYEERGYCGERLIVLSKASYNKRVKKNNNEEEKSNVINNISSSNLYSYFFCLISNLVLPTLNVESFCFLYFKFILLIIKKLKLKHKTLLYNSLMGKLNEWS